MPECMFFPQLYIYIGIYIYIYIYISVCLKKQPFLKCQCAQPSFGVFCLNTKLYKAACLYNNFIGHSTGPKLLRFRAKVKVLY